MTFVDTLIILLIINRIAALVLVSIVMRRQLRHVRLLDDPEYIQTRHTLFGLTVVAFFANLIPLGLDFVILLEPALFTNAVLLFVLSSNAIGDLFQAILIYKLYRK